MIFVAVVLLVSGVTAAASAGAVTEHTKLAPIGGSDSHLFGWSVAVEGETAAVGAIDDLGVGAVYIYERSRADWRGAAKLMASDRGLGQEFGRAVALSAETLVVGTMGGSVRGHQWGSVYVFTRSAGMWTETDRISATDHPATLPYADGFGRAVAVSGDTIVVGASAADGAAPWSGAAYVFTRVGDSWLETAKLTPSDGISGDMFGRAVAVSGDTVVVGARRSDDQARCVDAAYVFSRSGDDWEQVAKLVPSETDSRCGFGQAVAMSGETVVVGASGAAYVFDRAGKMWSRAKLEASESSGNTFGNSVAVEGDTVVVGDYYDGPGMGSVYGFSRSGGGWIETVKLVASDGSAEDQFGTSVALTDGTVVVGSPFDGSAYVFDLPTPTGVPRCTAIGSNGDDVLYGTPGRDVICGLGGDDVIYGRGGDDELRGGPGADRILGGDGNDKIFGHTGNDELTGGGGSDRIYPGTGIDTVDGGRGSSDWVMYRTAKRGVVVSLRAGVATGQGRDTLVNVENIVGSRFADTLIGNGRKNRIVAGAGADLVRGKGGDDRMSGRAGPDVLRGGAGFDTARGGSGADTCTAEVKKSC